MDPLPLSYDKISELNGLKLMVERDAGGVIPANLKFLDSNIKQKFAR